MESLPRRRLVAEPMLDDYDTLLVESPPSQPLLSPPVREATNAEAKMAQPA
jgi:hypothetical protein